MRENGGSYKVISILLKAANGRKLPPRPVVDQFENSFKWEHVGALPVALHGRGADGMLLQSQGHGNRRPTTPSPVLCQSFPKAKQPGRAIRLPRLLISDSSTS